MKVPRQDYTEAGYETRLSAVKERKKKHERHVRQLRDRLCSRLMEFLDGKRCFESFLASA